MNALHPAFAEILGAAQQAPAALRRAAYVSALIKHDWEYDWSDDGRVFREGVAQRAALRAEAEQIDPTREIWNRHCPAGHQVVAS